LIHLSVLLHPKPVLSFVGLFRSVLFNHFDLIVRI
jgi:hypothetical protein